MGLRGACVATSRPSIESREHSRDTTMSDAVREHPNDVVAPRVERARLRSREVARLAPRDAAIRPLSPFLFPPVWFAAVLALMLVLHFWLPLAQWNLGMSRWWGIPFTGAGILILMAGLQRLGTRTTLHPFEVPSVLITGGAFRWSRNPLYTGMLLSQLGAAIMLGSLSPLIAIPLFVWVLRTRFIDHEERMLEQRFGAAYRDYRRRVRRWL
jgi:protein-S-isoprenylcysteine O-methyltransferase Ste14